ncbi:hypothetical protein FDECE_12117 [Fusarium decemcellulare]|nr:hypothetical protein FDECE_12117 [Fusarium decemcellulare]
MTLRMLRGYPEAIRPSSMKEWPLPTGQIAYQIPKSHEAETVIQKYSSNEKVGQKPSQIFINTLGVAPITPPLRATPPPGFVATVSRIAGRRSASSELGTLRIQWAPDQQSPYRYLCVGDFVQIHLFEE